MRKLTIQDWNALNARDVKIIFLRFKGSTVKDLFPLIDIPESTVYKYSDQIVKKLRMKDWDEVEETLGPHLIEWAYDVNEFDNWTKGFEDKLRQFEETEETKITPQKKSLTPILVVLILILAAALFINQIFPANPTPIQTPQVIRETVIVTVEVASVPDETVVANTPVPITPMPADNIATEVPDATAALAPDIIAITASAIAATEVPVLTVGSSITEGFYSLELVDKSYNTFIFGARRAITLNYEFSNKSFEEILLILDADDFILKDNLDRVYPCEFFISPYAGKEMNRSINGNKVFPFRIICGREISFDADVKDVILSAPTVYSIPASEWIINVAP